MKSRSRQKDLHFLSNEKTKKLVEEILKALIESEYINAIKSIKNPNSE